MEEAISVFIANDHSLLRDGIKKTILENPNIRIVGEAGSFAEIFEKLDSSKTDILITDDQMPDGDFKESLYKIRQHWPKLKVIVLSLFPKEAKHLVEVKHLIDAIVKLDMSETDLNKVINKI